ncbi:MAG: hypothetical protein GX119_06750 [Syntrophomonadaceae bacterium]|nr:hypothetical protein [Syntrophomonadaceae bacterium]
MDSIKDRLRKIEILVTLLLLGGLMVFCGCSQEKHLKGVQPEFTPGHLTIMGNGVEVEKIFSLEELKNKKEAQRSEAYSMLNDWPSPRIIVGKGITVSALLEEAGIKPEAKAIKVWAADGYNTTLTREQLFEKRYYYPALLEGSEEGAKEVTAILAWEYGEGIDDLSQTRPGPLCLLLGQKGLKNTIAPACVKDVVTLEVVKEAPGCWDEVHADPSAGQVEAGTEVFLLHSQPDKVKIYYTIDGSVPDERSILYNPSTSYFQPELTKAIIINESLIIKTIAIGLGKENSQVSSFAYQVE